MQLSPLLVKMDGVSLCEQVFAKYNHTLIHTSPSQQEKTPPMPSNTFFPNIQLLVTSWDWTIPTPSKKWKSCHFKGC